MGEKEMFKQKGRIMSKFLLISILFTTITAVSAEAAVSAEEDDSLIFAGIAMLYAQGRTPDEYLVESLGYKDIDPDWLRTEEVLIKTQAEMAADMAKTLQTLNACSAETWKEKPEKTAKKIDDASKKIMAKYFRKAEVALSMAQYSTLVRWIQKNKHSTHYLWLSQMNDPSLEVFGMCARFRQGGEL